MEARRLASCASGAGRILTLLLIVEGRRTKDGALTERLPELLPA
jgi:hypothetical protein